MTTTPTEHETLCAAVLTGAPIASAMKPEIKALWLDALRSGDYAQTQTALNRVEPDERNPTAGVGYCCLGVLSDLAVKAGVGEWRDSPTPGCKRYVGPGDDEHELDESDAYLAPSVQRWAGLDDLDPIVEVDADAFVARYRLSGLNDKGDTFAQIADVIERAL